MKIKGLINLDDNGTKRNLAAKFLAAKIYIEKSKYHQNTNKIMLNIKIRMQERI